MTKHMRVALWVCVAAAVVAGSARVEGACAMVASEPDALLFEQTRIDVGPVSDQEPIRRAFRFTNNTGRTISLSIGHCSFCPPPETDKQVYTPGESGLVILELTTMGRYGDSEASATVGVSGMRGTSVNLTLAARVCPAVRVEPSGLNLPMVVRAQGASETLTVVGRRAGFEVTGVRSLSEWVEATLGDGKDIEDLGQPCRLYEVVLKFRPGLPAGKFEYRIEMTTNEPTRDRIGYSITGEVMGDMIARPDHVTVAALRPGAIFTAEFDLQTRSGDPLLPGDVTLEVRPINEVSECVLDAVMSDSPGVLRVTVTGRMPPRAMPTFDFPVIARSVQSGEAHEIDIRLSPRMSAPGR